MNKKKYAKKLQNIIFLNVMDLNLFSLFIEVQKNKIKIISKNNTNIKY